jgi:predicted dehydrogenase
MKKYNAIIIGAGSIGALKDEKYDSPKTKNILTIAHAMYRNPDIDLKYIVDVDNDKGQRAAQKWQCKHITHLDDIIQQEIDIVAVCTPTNTHNAVIKNVVKHIKPQIIIAEKPFCSTTREAKEIVRLCHKNDIILVIDYIRRYDTSLPIIHSLVEYSDVYNVTVQYNRGFIHEACHAVDMMNYWFGDCKSVSVFNKKNIIDRDKTDPAAFICCEHEYATVNYLPVDGREYSIFEIQIMTSKGKILITDHGKRIHYYKTIPEPTYGNYKTLTQKPEIIKTELTTALSNMIDECVKILDGCFWITCTGEDALKVHDVIDKYNKARGRK